MAWKWEWNGNTDYYDEEITRDTDWAAVPQENGESIPVSGGRIQEWLKNEINGKYGVIRISRTINEQNFYSLEMFSTKEDEELYDNDPETYADRISTVTIPINAIQNDYFSAVLSTSLPMNDIVVIDENLEVPFKFHAIKISSAGSENTGNKGTLVIQRSTDDGTSWNTVGTIQNSITSVDTDSDAEETINIGKYLTPGKQLIRVRATFNNENNAGVEETINSSYVYVGSSVTKTSLKLNLVTNYEVPMDAYDVNDNANPFSVTYTVYGSVQKKHYVKIDNGTPLTYDYDASVDSINKTVSANVSKYMTHGVHKVESWLECEDGLGNTLKSDTLINRFMVVNKNTSGADLTKSYLLLQNVDRNIENFVQTQIAEYAVYSPSGSNIDIAFLLTKYSEDYETIKPEEYFRLETVVEPRKQYSLLTTIEIENEKEGTEILKYDTYFRVRRINGSANTDFMNESTGETSYYILVDNSNAFTPVSGATFLMNPKIRNNNEDDPARILNVKNDNAVIASTWTNFGFINDGWMVADDKQKVLRVMAGSTLEIKKNIWAQFLSNPNSSMTFEMDFKIDNVTNTTDPIVRMFEGTTSSFKGVCMNALEGWIMNASNTTKDNCLFSWQEGVRTHLSINLHHQVKPNKGDVTYTTENASKANGIIALARVLINGDCVREIPFSTTNANEWCSSSDGSIIIGNEGADIDIYSIRIYENKVIEMTDILNRNYLSTLSTSEEKTKLKDKNDLLDGGRISLEKTKNKGLNCMVWHGVLPYHGNQAEQTGWVEIYRYDADGNYLPEYSGTNCKETKSLVGKGQGSTAKTYYDWNLQEDNSKVKATIKVDIKKIHPEIKVSDPYVGEDGSQYVDIYGGHLGKNAPVEIPENAQPYPYTNGKVTVPDGWIDGNGMYRGMGYRVAEGTSLAQKKVIKINYASSMQSHLIGACNTYDLLHRKVVGDTPLQEVIPDAVSAKRTEPFMFFNQEGDGNVYFKGMGTYGAGKADKVTWGFVKKQMPMYALIEGSDNNLPMTGFRVPFDKNTAVYDVDGEGWLYNGQQSFDFDLGNTDSDDVPIDAITQRWADIHNFIYLHSTNLKYFNGTYEEFLQSSSASDTNYKYWCTQGDQAFYLKRYDFINKSWVDAGLLSGSTYKVFNLTEKTPTINAYNSWVEGGTRDYIVLNKAFIEVTVSHMRKYLKCFINEKSLQFNYCYVLGFLAGTDNSDKNTYYKIDPIGVQMEEDASFASWYKDSYGKDFDFTSVHQLYLDGDDMDSIFRTNNNSHQTKPYYIDRLHPYADGSTTSLYEGMGNQLFNFVEKAYEGTNELSSMMNQIMIAATELVNEEDRLYTEISNKKSLWGFLHKYFFNIQQYFPQIAYLEQARIRYEFPELLGFISSGGGARSIRPITQSLGSQLQNELQYMNQRVIYMTSYAGFGAWGGDTTHAIGLSEANETFSFTPAAMPDGSGSTYTFTITPHQYIYPSYFYGGTFTSTHQRTSPSQTCTFTIAENVLGSDTGMGICGINYISELGDFKNKSLTANLIINGKRLTRIYCGYSKSEFRPVAINITANNVKSVFLGDDSNRQDSIDCSMLIRATSIACDCKKIIYPRSSNLREIYKFGYETSLVIEDTPNLNKITIYWGRSVENEVIIGRNVGTNTDFSWQSLIELIVREQKSLTTPYLKSVHVENINWTDFDVKTLSWLADIPTCEFIGTISIKEPSTLAPAVTWDLKNKFLKKWGYGIDTSTGNLKLVYARRNFNKNNAYIKGNYYVNGGSKFKFEVVPGSIYENTQNLFQYSIDGGEGEYYSIHSSTGELSIWKNRDTQHFATVTVRVYSVGDNAWHTLTKTIEIWNRPAQLGDLVYYDGTYSSVATYNEEKTPIGICFYIAPRNADGSVNETFNNPNDKQLRLMVALEDVVTNGENTTFTTMQWGTQPIVPAASDDFNNREALFDLKSDGTRVQLTSDKLTSIYNIPSIRDIAPRGTSDAILPSSDYRDVESENGIINDGFKCITPDMAVGDGFAYKELSSYLNERTLTRELALLAGSGYEVGDVVNSGYAKTLKVIAHRNTLLTNDILGADGEVFISKGFFPLPSSTSTKKEIYSLGILIEGIRSWAKETLQDAYPNKWSQLCYPFASACYAYEPNVQKNEILSDRFTSHNWFAPTQGILSRIYWYVKCGTAQGMDVFGEAIDRKITSFRKSSAYWSITEYDSRYVWFVDFTNGNTNLEDKRTGYIVRPVASF